MFLIKIISIIVYLIWKKMPRRKRKHLQHFSAILSLVIHFFVSTRKASKQDGKNHYVESSFRDSKSILLFFRIFACSLRIKMSTKDLGG